MSTGKKLFSAEIKRLKQMSGELDETPLDPRGILDAIADLKAEVKDLKASFAAQPSAEKAAKPHSAAHSPAEAGDLDRLVAETRAMHQCIERTKQEIAALHTPFSSQQRFGSVTGELDAIINATEAATESILSAAEKIDSLSDSIENSAMDEYVSGHVADIRSAVVEIFEASSFQDITGQRIGKVVRALKFIEERVNTMVEIWGDEALATVVLTEEDLDEDAKLLNGPQLDGAISQEEIDKMFG